LAEDGGLLLLRKHIAALSGALNTPMPYFLSLPIGELQEWGKAAQQPKKR